MRPNCGLWASVMASIFGSVARGDAREYSDVDVLVDLHPGVPEGTT